MLQPVKRYQKFKVAYYPAGRVKVYNSSFQFRHLQHPHLGRPGSS